MPESAEAFLIAFHDAHPGVTARAFARGALDGAGSSYDALAAAVADEPGPVVDLGCGDGYLLELVGANRAATELMGIDLSGTELAMARRRTSLAGAALVQGRADALPLPDGTVGAMVSHLAFMLMTPLDRVVAEIARVLAPGARFVTAIGGGPCADDTFERFLTVLRGHAGALPRPAPRIGDRRARSPLELRRLFGPTTGFEAPRITDHVLDLRGPEPVVWECLASLYELGFASQALLAAMRAELARACADLVGSDGALPLAMRITLMTTRRLG